MSEFWFRADPEGIEVAIGLIGGSLALVGLYLCAWLVVDIVRQAKR